MSALEIVKAQLNQARSNQAEAAFNEDCVEAGVWTIRIEALEDIFIELAVDNQQENNVVNIHG